MSAKFQPEPNRFSRNQDFTLRAPSVPAEAEDADTRLWGLLSLYADGETTSEETAEVEAALRSDPALSRDLGLLRLTAASVPRLREIEPPTGLRDAILARTSRRPALPQRLAAFLGLPVVGSPASGARRAAFGLGAALAAGLAAFLFVPRAGQPGHPQTSGTSPIVSARTSAPALVAPVPRSVAGAPGAAGPPVPLATPQTPQALATASAALDTLPIPSLPDLLKTAQGVMLNKNAFSAKAAKAALSAPLSKTGLVKMRLTPKSRAGNAQVASNGDRSTKNELRHDFNPTSDSTPYTINPKMDDINQRRIAETNPGDEESTTSGSADPAPADLTPASYVPVSTPRILSAPHSGQLIASSLSAIPPDERFSATNKELFANIRARTGGLPDDIVRSNAQGLAQVSLIRLPLR